MNDLIKFLVTIQHKRVGVFRLIELGQLQEYRNKVLILLIIIASMEDMCGLRFHIKNSVHLSWIKSLLICTYVIRRQF
jgi:hypothetical protein